MSWLSESPPFFAALAVVIVPGMAVAFALGARGTLLLWLAPPFSISVIALGALANQVFPYRWGIFPLIATTIFSAGITYWARRAWRKRWPDIVRESASTRKVAASVFALVLGLVLIVSRLTYAFDQPSNISQTFDNVYHLNAVRYILDGGSASPFEQLIPGFYPDVWHVLVAIVVLITHVSIPVAVNYTSIVLAAVVWPMGCMFLARQIVGPRLIVIFSSGVLSAAFAAFPLSMLDFGVLYPNVLSISLLPAAFAAVIAVLGLSKASLLSAPANWWALAAWVPALAMSHPSTLIALIAISFPPLLLFAVLGFVRLFRRKASVGIKIRYGGVWLTFAAAAALVLLKARPTYAQAFWPPSESFFGALGSGLSNSALGKPLPIAITTLMLIGIIAVFAQRERRWLVGALAVVVGLYVICASFPAGSTRYWLTGTWYSDDQRIAALIPVIALPLATIGSVFIFDMATKAVKFFRAKFSQKDWDRVPVRGSVSAVAVIVIIGLITLTQIGPSLSAATASAHSIYVSNARSPLLSADEQILLDRIGKEVPKDAVVAGSPWTGTSLSYAISDRKALIPHIYAAWTPDIQTIVLGLRDAIREPEVCRALNRTHVGYVLDFGTTEVHGGNHPYPGFENLSASSSVQLIDQVGGARLYKVIACK